MNKTTKKNGVACARNFAKAAPFLLVCFITTPVIAGSVPIHGGEVHFDLMANGPTVGGNPTEMLFWPKDKAEHTPPAITPVKGELCVSGVNSISCKLSDELNEPDQPHHMEWDFFNPAGSGVLWDFTFPILNPFSGVGDDIEFSLMPGQGYIYGHTFTEPAKFETAEINWKFSKIELTFPILMDVSWTEGPTSLLTPPGLEGKCYEVDAMGNLVESLSQGCVTVTPHDPEAAPPDNLAFNLEITFATPIPGALWLFGSGLLGLIGIARKRKHA